jgi:23S rRNA (cytosine1962-C5)-methyltransferase
MPIFYTEKSKDYELIDSGDCEKLERYGELVLRRPDPQAIWSKSLSTIEWEKANATYVRSETSGKWSKQKNVSVPWNIELEGINFSLDLLPSKHLGVFPEQVSQWKWLEKIIKEEVGKRKEINVLNLFGYTGGASLICASAGAKVCHVDGSKFAVDLANKNMKNSGLDKKEIRFIVDDVRKFVEREIKRGNKYDIIIMDPPVYGKGAKGEVWKLEKDLLPFVKRISQVLSSSPLAVVLNGYASNYSATTYAQVLSGSMPKGEIEHGELGIKESEGGRILNAGIFARWSK